MAERRKQVLEVNTGNLFEVDERGLYKRGCTRRNIGSVSEMTGSLPNRLKNLMENVQLKTKTVRAARVKSVARS